MNVLCNVWSLEGSIVCEHVLLTSLAGLGRNLFLNGMSVRHLHGLESLSVSRISCDGRICDGVCEGLEIRCSRNEVGLAAEADDNRLVAVDAHENSSLGSLAVSPLGCNELAFLTDDVHSLLEIAFSLNEGILAIHHSGAGHLA